MQIRKHLFSFKILHFLLITTMDSSDQADRISNLPYVLLVLIVSCLSFKECVQTCALSKRWRFVYLETRNVSFKETDFLSHSVNTNPIKNALDRIVSLITCVVGSLESMSKGSRYLSRIQRLTWMWSSPW